MKKILCTVNPDQVQDAHKRKLEHALRSNYAAHLSATEKLVVIWCELPKTQGYTNYKQPCVALVVIESQNNLDQKSRESMLLACAKDWSHITGVSTEQLMISVFNQAEFAAYLKANQRRLSMRGRIEFAKHVAVSLLRSKVARGLLVFSPNLSN